jgi:inhibitor of KinA sporulation pathway (predicted exonuclease)
MTLVETMILVVLVVIVLALILFPDFRGKLKVMCGGILNLFIEDKAKTVKGAEAVYQQAIEEATDDYCRASDMLRQVSGQLNLAQRDLESKKEQFKKVTDMCETLVKNGRVNEAMIKAEERESLEIEVNAFTVAINRLTPVVNDAIDINDKCDKALAKLKRDKTQKIAEMKLNQDLNKAYDNMDELKRNTSTKKLLDSVGEGVRSSQEKAVGAKVIYENKLSTKIEKADKTAQALSTNNYIEDLKKKYNK